MRLAMALTVRDEADIIEDCLRYHRGQGVDLFVVCDNGSTDGTLSILERCADAGFLHLEHFEGSARDLWEIGATRIARIAADEGADWVVHADADEFWWPLQGTLKETLERIPARFGMVSGPRTEFIPRLGDAPFPERMTIRETRALRGPKTAHRASAAVRLCGTHPHQIWVEDGPASSTFSGRPGLRGEGHDAAEIPSFELILAPDFPARVLHYPLRSLDQYRRRVARAIESGPGAPDEVRAAYEEGRLDETYEALVPADDEVAEGLEAGWLTSDTGFRDFLAASPPLFGDGDGAAPQPAPPGAWLEQESRELTADGMYAVSRVHQRAARRATLARERRQAARAATTTSAAAHARESRRLAEIESSRWWRLRPRVPRRLRRFLRRRLRDLRSRRPRARAGE
jgi:hypothetical protein